MSDNHLYQVITSDRAIAENIRLKSVLDERNQALHITEQQLQIAEQKLIDNRSQLKQAHLVMRLFMILAVLAVLVLAFGGAK